MTHSSTPVMAHRGASAEFPEHTLAAFKRAIEVGANGIEVDVHLTQDGHVVCIHDHTLDRTSNGSGPVAEHTLEQLRETDFGSWSDWTVPEGSSVSADDAHGILTLGELLDLMLEAGKGMHLAVETKHPSPAGGKLDEAVARILREKGLIPKEGQTPSVQVRVISFDEDALSRMSALAPGIPLEQLWEHPHEEYLEGRFPEHISISGPSIELLTEFPEITANALEQGMRVHPWTIDEPDDVDRCLAASVEMITTNRPLQVLERVRTA